jgi:metal-responsive CopG/Arc/MetJ family transcriptional regulator
LDILSAIIKDQTNKQEKQDFTQLDEAYRKLQVIKSKVTVLTNVLQGTQDRLKSMNKKIETFEASKTQ